MMSYTCGIIFTIGMIAQGSVAANWWEPLVASGPIGVVLLWFMLRSEKRTNEQTSAINNLVVMVADTILELKHGDAAIGELARRCKEQAEKLQKHENSSG